MKKVLIINAHQFYQGISTGKLNETMAGSIKEEMEKRDYEVMKQADVEADIARLRAHLASVI